jgi:hypothetical protein
MKSMNKQQTEARLKELREEITKLEKKFESEFFEHTWTPFEIYGKKFEISENLGEMNWEDAKKKCEELGGFLPPRWMLCFIYEELPELKNSFKSGLYWSSSEYSDTGARVAYFSDGGSASGNKTDAHYVRCVRGR